MTEAAHRPEPPAGAGLDAYRTLARLAARETDTAGPGDVNTALTLVGAVRADLDRCELTLIRCARAAGVSWTDIAASLSLRSRQAAQQRYRRLLTTAPDTHPTTAAGKALTSEPAGAAADPAPARDDEDGDQANGHRPHDTYDLTRSEHYAHTGTWLVTVDGQPIGSVRPEHRGTTKRWSAWHGHVRIARGQTYRTRTDAAVPVLMAHGEHTRPSRTRRRERQ